VSRELVRVVTLRPEHLQAGTSEPHERAPSAHRRWSAMSMPTFRIKLLLISVRATLL
jgi:hypothetical protein